MGQLTFAFHGVCTHFRKIVPGIPHRVVLPNAGALQYDTVFVESLQLRLYYYAMPHLATFRIVNGEQSRLNVGRALVRGDVFDGVRIEVANPLGHEMIYDSTYEDNIKHLQDYVPNYSYSDEVVQNGRAACYIDLHAARMVKAFVDGQATTVTATILTDGAPALHVTPFFNSPQILHRLQLADDPEANVHLQVHNFSALCEHVDSNFDFLLHYLTAKGGIPRVLTKPTPGLLDVTRAIEPRPLSAEALEYLRTFHLGDRPEPRLDFATPACSDAGYP